MTSQAQVEPIEPSPIVAQDHRGETRRALIRNISFDVIARIGYLVSRVFIPPFVLAHVGLSAYSLWSAVFLIVAYVGVSSIGFTSAYVKLVAEYVGHGETRKANSVLSTGLVICGLVSGSFLVLLALGMPQVLRWFHVPANLVSDARYVILLVVGMHSCEIVLSVFKSALAGSQKILEVQRIWVVQYLLEAALVFFFVGAGYGIRGLADAFALSTGMSIVLNAMLARRIAPWLHISMRSVSRESWQRLFHFGGVLQCSAVLIQTLESAERLIAAPLIGLDAVGVLDIASKLPRVSTSIPSAFAGAFMPASAYLHAGLPESERRNALQKLYLKGSRYMIFVASAMLGFMATAAGPILLAWMGKVYSGTIYLMAIFAIQQHFDCLTGPGTSILRGMGRPWQEFSYTIPNFLLAALFIPLSRLVTGGWSATGLGTAIAASQIVAAIGFIARANRLFELSWRQYARAVLLPSAVPYLVGWIFALPALRLAASTNRWHVALAVLGVGAIYVIVLCVVMERFVLTNEERHWFRETVNERWLRYKSLFRALLKLIPLQSA